MAGKDEQRKDFHSKENKSWQAWGTYVERLAERRAVVLMSKSKKDACGCSIEVLREFSVYSRDTELRQRISVSAP